MAVYLLIANILLINLLIAIFNHIFQEVNAISQQIWKFQRFYVVMEYEQMPVLPPPLIILNHLYLIIKFLCRKLGGRKLTYDHSLKLFLYGEGLQSIYDYEEECVDGYFQEIDTKVKMSADDQVKCTNERVESMSQKVDDVYHRENLATMTLQMLDLRLTHLEEVTEQTATSLSTIQRILELWEAQQLPASMTESMISDQEMPPSPANPSPSDQPTEKQTEIDTPLGASNQPDLPPLQLSPVQPVEPSPIKSSLHQKRIMRRRLQRSMRQSSCDEEPPTGSETHRTPPKIAVLRSLSVTRSEPDYPLSVHSSPKFERSYSVAPPAGSHDHPIHVIPATPRPLLSATRNVYTSITDELEGLLTPAATPSLKRLGSSSSDTTEQALQAEAHMLHSAELADYQMMEGLIQRRLHRNSENLTTSLEELCSTGYDSEQNDDAPPIARSPSPGLSNPSLSSTSQQQSQPLKSPQRPLKSSLKKPSVRAETQCWQCTQRRLSPIYSVSIDME